MAFLDRFEPGARARVLARVPPASREIIETTPDSQWVPVEHDRWTVDAMIELFGRERATQCWRDALIDLLERPPLREFVARTVKEFGRDPVSVVRLFAKGWSLVYRDVCEPLLIAAADGQPVIRFENIAEAIRVHRNYLDCWYGACQGFAHVAQVRGHVQFSVAEDFLTAEAKFFWEPGA